MELVLAAAMLLPLMLLAYHMTRLIYARLELVSLTREAAMLMIHEARSDLPSGILTELAKRTRLDPDNVTAEVVAASLGSQMSGEASAQGLEAVVKKMLLGSRLQIHYRLRFAGLLGKLRPEGLRMTETVVFQSGTWKNLGWDELKKMLTS